MKQRFFGNPESPLFGVYHAPRGKSESPARAVLLVPPIGQEFIRSHWCMRLMANQMSRSGSHVLRMDLSGMGDSSGNLQQVSSLEVWQRDVRLGIDHLKQLAGAQTVMLVGLRFGAMIAAETARRSVDVNSVILWEPVTDGLVYLNELRRMHRQMLDLWVCRMKTPNDDALEEILGSCYSRKLIENIENSVSGFGDLIQPQLIVDCVVNGETFLHPEPSVQKVIMTEDEFTWDDLRALETAWLRPQTTRLIVKHTADMFARLKKFQALNQPPLMPTGNRVTMADVIGAV